MLKQYREICRNTVYLHSANPTFTQRSRTHIMNAFREPETEYVCRCMLSAHGIGVIQRHSCNAQFVPEAEAADCHWRQSPVIIFK